MRTAFTGRVLAERRRYDGLGLKAALAAQAALELDEPPPPNEALLAFQTYLGALAPIDVLWTRKSGIILGC
jgi:hypothetical protein